MTTCAHSLPFPGLICAQSVVGDASAGVGSQGSGPCLAAAHRGSPHHPSFLWASFCALQSRPVGMQREAGEPGVPRETPPSSLQVPPPGALGRSLPPSGLPFSFSETPVARGVPRSVWDEHGRVRPPGPLEEERPQEESPAVLMLLGGGGPCPRVCLREPPDPPLLPSALASLCPPWAGGRWAPRKGRLGGTGGGRRSHSR